MATAITTHIVVEFGTDDATPNVIVEIDSRENGYNGGRTSFQPGESAYLLLFVPPGWEVDYTAASAGSLTYVEDASIDKEDFLTFIDDETNTLQYPVSGAPTFGWLGNNLGAVSVSNNVCSLTPRTYNPTLGAFTPEHRVGIAKASYESVARVYRVSGVPVSVSKVVAMFVVRKL